MYDFDRMLIIISLLATEKKMCDCVRDDDNECEGHNVW